MIYAIETKQAPYVKIGYAASVEHVQQRLRNMQTGNPHDLVLLWMLPGDHETEKTIHTALRGAHHRGEWFLKETWMRDPDELMEVVAAYYKDVEPKYRPRRRQGSLRALAEELGVSHTTVRRWIADGKLSGEGYFPRKRYIR